MANDQVTHRAGELIESYRHLESTSNSLLSWKFKDIVGPYVLGDGELARIAAFLTAHHKPHVPVAPTARPSNGARQPTAPQQTAARHRKSAPICRHCQGADLSVVYGLFGYYFKCADCQGNTRIDAACPQCGDKQTIRKNGMHFIMDCKRCATTSLCFTNRA